MSSVIDSDIYYFLQFQNNNRGLAGEEVQKDYYYNGVTPIGANTVAGIAGIGAGAASFNLNLSAIPGYNAVIFDGAQSAAASASGAPDNYTFSVDSAGTVTVTDSNNGHSQQISGASYLVFDGGAQNADGSYKSIFFVESGSNAQIAALYNAALGRQPDLPGLEYYAVRLAKGEMSLHQEAANFLASPEFLAKYPAAAAAADNGGAHDQAFVTQLYQNILHRTPGSAELAYYVSDLQGTLAGVPQQDRAQLLINFSVSAENQQDIAGWLVGIPAASHG